MFFSNLASRTFECKAKHVTLTGYHIDNPGFLSDEDKKRVFEELYPVAVSAFSRERSEEMEKDVWEHVFSVDGLLVVTDIIDGKETVVAFRMWQFIEYSVTEGDILYLAGMCVHKDYQGKGIGRALLDYVLWQDLRRQFTSVDQICPLPPCRYVVLRTQNPVMKRAFDKATGVVSYPCEVGGEIPESIRKVAQKVANFLGDTGFDSATLTSPALYGHSLYGHNPSVDDPRYKRLFNDMNLNRGDAMVCVWRRE